IVSSFVTTGTVRPRTIEISTSFPMLRQLIVTLLIALSTATVARAIPPTNSTLSGKLVLGPRIGSTIQTIQIFIKSDAPFAFAQAAFHVVSEGTGNVNFGDRFIPQSTIFSPSIATYGYLSVKPSVNIDGAFDDVSQWLPQPVLGAVPDGDFDAVGMAVFSVP